MVPKGTLSVVVLLTQEQKKRSREQRNFWGEDLPIWCWVFAGHFVVNYIYIHIHTYTYIIIYIHIYIYNHIYTYIRVYIYIKQKYIKKYTFSCSPTIPHEARWTRFCSYYILGPACCNHEIVAQHPMNSHGDYISFWDS